MDLPMAEKSAHVDHEHFAHLQIRRCDSHDHRREHGRVIKPANLIRQQQSPMRPPDHMAMAMTLPVTLPSLSKPHQFLELQRGEGPSYLV